MTDAGIDDIMITFNIVAEQSRIKVGDRFHIFPNHVCVVSNRLNEVALRTITGDYVTVPIDARGCVW